MENSRPSTIQGLTPRQVITATLTVVGVSLAFWLLYSFRQAFILLFIAAFLGTAIRPMVDWLFRRGVPRTLGVLLIFLLMLGIVVGVGLLLVPLLVEQSSDLALRLPTIYQNLRNQGIVSPSRIIRLIAFQLPQIQFLGSAVPEAGEINPLDQVNTLLTFSGQTVEGLFAFLTVFLLAYYWTLESERTLRGLMLWIPSQSRPGLRTLIAEIEEKVGGFVRGQAVLCLAIGLAALAAYALIGLPNALVLALLAGIFEAVPVVGPILGAAPAFMIALTMDTQHVIGVLIATVVIQTLENYFLVPRIMKRAVGVNAIVALLALITLTSLFGLIGALLAIPIAAILQLLMDRFLLSRRLDSATTIQERDYSGLLQYEYEEFRQDIRKVIRKKDEDTDDQNDEFEDELERLVNQMEELIARVNKVEGNP
jgi:predicted PurR-regulated permease PerM